MSKQLMLETKKAYQSQQQNYSKDSLTDREAGYDADEGYEYEEDGFNKYSLTHREQQNDNEYQSGKQLSGKCRNSLSFIKPQLFIEVEKIALKYGLSTGLTSARGGVKTIKSSIVPKKDEALKILPDLSKKASQKTIIKLPSERELALDRKESKKFSIGKNMLRRTFKFSLFLIH